MISRFLKLNNNGYANPRNKKSKKGKKLLGRSHSFLDTNKFDAFGKYLSEAVHINMSTLDLDF